MRARYYSPEMKRFVNADILPGGISEAITLNRYAYANGNPVSFVDPFGLEAEHILSFKQVAKQRLQAELEEKFELAKERLKELEALAQQQAIEKFNLVSISDFINDHGGEETSTGNNIQFSLNDKNLSVKNRSSRGNSLSIFNFNGELYALEHDLAYYFRVDNWVTYFPGYTPYTDTEGFGVKTTSHFLNKDFCLDYDAGIIELRGEDGMYLGHNQQVIAKELYAHAVLYLGTDLSVKTLGADAVVLAANFSTQAWSVVFALGAFKIAEYRESAEEIGFTEEDNRRWSYKLIWILL